MTLPNEHKDSKISSYNQKSLSSSLLEQRAILSSSSSYSCSSGGGFMLIATVTKPVLCCELVQTDPTVALLWGYGNETTFFFCPSTHIINCKCLGEAAATAVIIQDQTCNIGRIEPVEKHDDACCHSTPSTVGAGGVSNSWLEHTRNANLNTNDSSSDSLNLGGGSMFKSQRCKAIRK